MPLDKEETPFSYASSDASHTQKRGGDGFQGGLSRSRCIAYTKNARLPISRRAEEKMKGSGRDRGNLVPAFSRDKSLEEL